MYNLPGCSAAEFNSFVTKREYADISGVFPAEEYIEGLLATTPEDMTALLAQPEGVDRNVWILENSRIFLRQINDLILALGPVCNKETDPSMKLRIGKKEEVYLCAVFDPARECAAIDYMMLTVDHATAFFTSDKHFPSRVTVKEGSAKMFSTWIRRLYRIFAFAYFVHPEVFNAFEDKTHLCERYTRFSLMYKLMTSSQLIIPGSRFNL